MIHDVDCKGALLTFDDGPDGADDGGDEGHDCRQLDVTSSDVGCRISDGSTVLRQWIVRGGCFMREGKETTGCNMLCIKTCSIV